ncbi:MAG: NlpC/P60 family protein [Candidatus Acidiferrales bacterium]
MDGMWTGFEWRKTRGLVAVLSMACFGAVCIGSVGVASAVGQVAVPVRESDASARLLTLEEGRSIVNVAWEQELPENGMRDCSHLVHQIYANAGFEYPYASSFEIYAGNENFERVRNPHPGDLIAWPGHVGIVVDALQHSFYSLVRTGLAAQDYRSAYWRSRGIPRFYRYKVEPGAMVNAAKTAEPSRVSRNRRQRSAGTSAEQRTVGTITSSDRPAAAVSERAEVIYGPLAPRLPPASKNADAPFAIPASVIISAGNKPPTREEVAEGISELSDAGGSVLRAEDAPKVQLPVVIVEQFKVEKVDVKHDHGWARLAVDSKVMMGGGAVQVKRRREKIRWELRRTELGWEALTPQDRTYVPHDVAVKNLAEQLARLTKSDGAAEHQPAVLWQEAQLVGLLSALLESKQDR